MTILSTLGKVCGELILVLGLAALLSAIALERFTEYKTLQPIMSDSISSAIVANSPNIQEQESQIMQGCKMANGSIGVNFSQGVGPLSLNCTEISNSQPSDIPRIVSNAVFDKIYYKQYSCGFIACLQQLHGNERLALITTQLANEFFNSIILPSLLAAAAGIVLVAAATRKWEGVAKSIGLIFIMAGAPFILFPLLGSYAQEFVAAGEVRLFQQVLATIFEPIKFYMLLLFVGGAVLAAAGFVGTYMKRRGGESSGRKPGKEK